MNFRGGLALSALIFSFASAALADQPVARIICGENSSDSWNIVTMRSDVFSSYRSPNIQLHAPTGEKLHGFTEGTVVYSNGLDLDVFIIASPFKAPPVLYRSLTSIPRRQGEAIRIASIVPASGNFAGYQKNGEFLARRIGYSPRGLLAYPTDADAYTVQNLQTNQTIKVKTKSADAGNPQFSEDGKWLALEVFDGKTFTITTKLFSLVSNQVLSLPTAAKGLSQVALSYAGDYVTWTEVALATSPNGYSMTFRAARLNGLSEKATARTIFTDRNPRMKGIRLYKDADGTYFTASTKEAYKQNPDSDYVGNGLILTRGEVFVNYFDKNLQPTTQETIPYPEKLIGSKRRTSMSEDGVLAREQIFSPGNVMIFTMGNLGGIATLDIKNKVWEFHANQDGSGCFNPAIGPEVAE
jgi:hypothetical protein